MKSAHDRGHDDAERVQAFEEARPLLFGIAYRMLGSASEAEDIVQEVYIRWHSADFYDVESPRAYLTTVVTRLCIDQLKSARARRETYVGTWLPEPLLTESSADVAELVALSDSLSMAYLTLLEQLTPIERAVLLLHDVFDFEYAEVAPVVEKTPANCRQIARRARARLVGSEPRLDPPSQAHRRLAESFVESLVAGNVDSVVTMLRDDVALWADSGGKALAPRQTLYGSEIVAKFLTGVVQREIEGLQWWFDWVNGQPAALVSTAGQLVAVLVLDVVDDGIAGLRLVANPDKLQGIAAQLPPSLS